MASYDPENRIKVSFWSELRRDQKVSILAFLVTPIAGVISAWIFGFGFQFYISLTIFATLAILTDKIGRLYFENETMKHFDRASMAGKDLHAIGTPQQGVAWLIENAAGLQHVQNTVFGRSNYKDHPGLGDEMINNFKSAIRKSLSSGCSWTDLVIRDEMAAIRDFEKILSDKQKSGYYYFEIDTDMPLLQAITGIYKDGRRFVLFGWSFEGIKGHKSMVFLSTNADTVDYFSTYLTNLENHAKKNSTPAALLNAAARPAPVPQRPAMS